MFIRPIDHRGLSGRGAARVTTDPQAIGNASAHQQKRAEAAAEHIDTNFRPDALNGLGFLRVKDISKRTYGALRRYEMIVPRSIHLHHPVDVRITKYHFAVPGSDTDKNSCIRESSF